MLRNRFPSKRLAFLWPFKSRFGLFASIKHVLRVDLAALRRFGKLSLKCHFVIMKKT